MPLLSRIRLVVGMAMLWVASGGCNIAPACGCDSCPLPTLAAQDCESILSDCPTSADGRGPGINCSAIVDPRCDSQADNMPLEQLSQCLAQTSCNGLAASRDAHFLEAAQTCEQSSGVSAPCAAAFSELMTLLGPCSPGPSDPCVPFGLLCAEPTSSGGLSCRGPQGAACSPGASDPCLQFGFLCAQDSLDGGFTCHTPDSALCDPAAAPDPCVQFGLLCAARDGGEMCGSPLGVPCTAGSPDKCVPVGFSCAQNDAGFSCALPSEISEPCLASVGCGLNLSCDRIFGSSLSPDGGTFACRWIDCTSTSECSAIDAACEDTILHCQPNACGPDADGGPYFGACSAETDAGDGQCLPFQAGGHCFETGPAAPGQACDPTRNDAGPYCAAGGFCFSGMDDRALPAAVHAGSLRRGSCTLPLGQRVPHRLPRRPGLGRVRRQLRLDQLSERAELHSPARWRPAGLLASVSKSSCRYRRNPPSSSRRC